MVLWRIQESFGPSNIQVLLSVNRSEQKQHDNVISYAKFEFVAYDKTTAQWSSHLKERNYKRGRNCMLLCRG
jgi:hypothetical protein